MVHTIDNKSLCDILFNYFQHIITVSCNAVRFRYNIAPWLQEGLMGGFPKPNILSNPCVGSFRSK